MDRWNLGIELQKPLAETQLFYQGGGLFLVVPFDFHVNYGVLVIRPVTEEKKLTVGTGLGFLMLLTSYMRTTIWLWQGTSDIPAHCWLSVFSGAPSPRTSRFENIFQEMTLLLHAIYLTASSYPSSRPLAVRRLLVLVSSVAFKRGNNRKISSWDGAP